jgi:hypothetical protein
MRGAGAVRHDAGPYRIFFLLFGAYPGFHPGLLSSSPYGRVWLGGLGFVDRLRWEQRQKRGGFGFLGGPAVGTKAKAGRVGFFVSQTRHVKQMRAEYGAPGCLVGSGLLVGAGTVRRYAGPYRIFFLLFGAYPGFHPGLLSFSPYGRWCAGRSQIHCIRPKRSARTRTTAGPSTHHPELTSVRDPGSLGMTDQCSVC